jgi:hypothetical protein
MPRAMQPSRRTFALFSFKKRGKKSKCTAIDSMARGIAGKETVRR